MAIYECGLPKVYFKDYEGNELLVIDTKEYYDYDNRKVLEYTLDDGRIVSFVANRGIK